MSRYSSVLLVAFAAIAAIAMPTTAAPASAAAQTVIYDCSGDEQVRPASIIVYCGDAGVTVGSITWSSWNRKTATGDGIEYTKVCVPNCAEGGVRTRPVRVLLDTVSSGEFTRITLSGVAGSERYKLTGASPNR